MFYTDGFLNENTYFSRGHIWHLGMRWNGKECLFLCIFDACPDKKPEDVEHVLKRWMEQELPQVIEKRATDIQREVTRFSVWFKKWCGMGETVKSPMLCLFFRGHIYSGESNKAVWSRFKGHRGMVLGGEGTSDDKEYFEKWSREILNSSISLEENANKLKTDMLVAFSKGIIKLGYFVLWEERDDF